MWPTLQMLLYICNFFFFVVAVIAVAVVVVWRVFTLQLVLGLKREGGMWMPEYPTHTHTHTDTPYWPLFPPMHTPDRSPLRAVIPDTFNTSRASGNSRTPVLRPTVHAYSH